jgi:hypothetical protein
MKKYQLSSQIRYDLNLYADPEFAAIFWKDIEGDLLDQTPEERNEEVETITINPGDKYEIEWLGFEFYDPEMVCKVQLRQDFSDKQINALSIKYVGWLPKSVLNLNDCKILGITVSRVESADQLLTIVTPEIA